MNSIKTKVAGVTFEGRQEVIKELKIGQELFLRPEYGNKYDNNAIKVVTQQNKQIGYLRRSLAADITSAYISGKKFNCYVIGINGGRDKNIGINIEIIRKADIPCGCGGEYKVYHTGAGPSFECNKCMKVID
jgi:hypothetical protein